MSSPLPESVPQETPKPAEGPAWLGWAKVVLFVLVLTGLVWASYGAWNELSTKNMKWELIGWGWLGLSAVTFLCGYLCCGVFWHYLLRGMGQQPDMYESVRAYMVSQVGKYFPGKAVVLAIRAGLVASPRTDYSVAGVCVFLETATMMAVGACLGGIVLMTRAGDSGWILWLALAMIVGSTIPTLPPIFRRIVLLAQVARIKEDIEKDLDLLGYDTLAIGWVCNTIGWLFMGISYWATIQAIWPALGIESHPEATAVLADPWQWLPVTTGTVALSVSLGIVSFMPGGGGAREGAITILMGTVLGNAPALVSSLVLRMVWLVAEVIAAIILYVLPPAARDPVPATEAKPLSAVANSP